MTKVSIVIPVYNAARILGESAKKVVAEAEDLNCQYEILLRDDFSTDNSPAILKQLTEAFPNIKSFYNPDNKGLGFTLRALLSDADGDVIIYTDADLPFGTKIFIEMLRGLKSADIFLASRYKGKSNKVEFFRKLASRAYAYSCKLLFGIKIEDIGSGSVAFKRDILEKLNLASDGFAIHAEIFAKAQILNVKVKEVGFESYGSKISSFSILKHGLPIIIQTFVLKFSSGLSETKSSVIGSA